MVTLSFEIFIWPFSYDNANTVCRSGRLVSDGLDSYFQAWYCKDFWSTCHWVINWLLGKPYDFQRLEPKDAWPQHSRPVGLCFPRHIYRYIWYGTHETFETFDKRLWFMYLFFILTGFCLVAYSILLGIYTAEGARWLYRRSNTKSYFNIPTCNSNKPASFITFMVMLMLMLGLLWSLFGVLVKQDFEKGGSEAQLFFACMVGPFGVWIRWFLARFNGRGLIKWMPVGTLAANVLAACVMAGLATLKKAVMIFIDCWPLVWSFLDHSLPHTFFVAGE